VSAARAFPVTTATCDASASAARSTACHYLCRDFEYPAACTATRSTPDAAALIWTQAVKNDGQTAMHEVLLLP
jgi:hypothetical protein